MASDGLFSYRRVPIAWQRDRQTAPRISATAGRGGFVLAAASSLDLQQHQRRAGGGVGWTITSCNLHLRIDKHELINAQVDPLYLATCTGAHCYNTPHPHPTRSHTRQQVPQILPNTWRCTLCEILLMKKQ